MSLQRTNKSFNARRWCGTRTYEYYLPAYVLGLDTPDGSSPDDQAKLALLRDVLQTYCGYKPFQNYAGNRSQYVGQRAKGESDDLQLYCSSTLVFIELEAQLFCIAQGSGSLKVKLGWSKPQNTRRSSPREPGVDLAVTRQ